MCREFLTKKNYESSSKKEMRKILCWWICGEILKGLKELNCLKIRMDGDEKEKQLKITAGNLATTGVSLVVKNDCEGGGDTFYDDPILIRDQTTKCDQNSLKIEYKYDSVLLKLLLLKFKMSTHKNVKPLIFNNLHCRIAVLMDFRRDTQPLKTHPQRVTLPNQPIEFQMVSI